MDGIKSLQEILHYVTIQFVIICDDLSFLIMFYNFTTNNHFLYSLIIFVIMAQLLNCTSLHID